MLALAGKTEAQPQFHMAPIVLDAPDGRDAIDNTASARSVPHIQRIPTGLAGVSTRRLTLQAIESDRMRMAAASSAAEGTASALAEGAIVKTYTPAQIRTAYGLPSIPPPYVSLSPRKAAWLGAGQTIYIIAARHNPNVVAELAAFNEAFGLPGCSTQQLPAGTPLPLAAAPMDGCVLSIAYTSPEGIMRNTAPAYDATWASEIALDVQWAHAIAPHARLVLIEAASSSAVDLMAAVALATRLGPGVVNMSFSTGEFSLAAMQQIGAPFDTAAMSFVASAGDRGSASNWPAADPRVLAVTGTRLSWLGRQRIETAWSSTGGATSQQVPEPTYQAGLLKPGDPATPGAVRWRGSADVAFNADPYTGQYIYMTPSDSTGGSGWSIAGGTSIAAVQWSGLLTLANALRAERALAPLGPPHARLYQAALGSSARWQAAFLDITAGRNGDCGAMCKSAPGYDLTSGLGSPRVEGLLELLAAP